MGRPLATCAMLRAPAVALFLALVVSPAPAGTLVGLRGRNAGALDALLAAQQDPASPEYQRWLTPKEFGERFGATPKDLKRVERWLRGDGCRIKRSRGRQQVECVGGRPTAVPSDVAALVDGVVDLDAPVELEHKLDLSGLRPQSVDPGGHFYLSPQEYAGFYGFADLHAAGLTGRGQRIGIVGTAGVDTDDVARFRTSFQLPALDLEQIGTPGSHVDDADRLEAILDVTWSGAVATEASVTLSITKGTVVDAIKYLVERPDVDILSLSLNPVPNRQNQPLIRQSLKLFKQGAAQGKTILIASGDFGALAIASPPKRGVDPYAQSPFVTGVGGTAPSSSSPQGVFTYGSESVWQEAKRATGGGRSTLARPKWQKGLKLGPTRTVPDVALAASGIYPIPRNGSIVCCVAGTSAAAPAWAGLVAMLNQKRGTRAGLLNPRLYELGAAQASGGAAVFHDIVDGTSTTSLAPGFKAKPGYDMATGWGSPDVAALFAAF